MILFALFVLRSGAEASTQSDPAGPGSASQDSVTVCWSPVRDYELTVRAPAAEARALLDAPLSFAGPCPIYGQPTQLGAGRFRTYVKLEAEQPVAVGVAFDADAIDNLPTEPSDGIRCLDVDQDRRIQADRECVGGHERVLLMPSYDVRLGLTPWRSLSVPPVFQWVLLNWNPAGHSPRAAWGVPHFDFHFFIQSLSERNAIRMGPCALLVHCEDLAVGRRPVPERFLPPGYEDRGIVEFAMGNHLIDAESPEFGGDHPFTHTFLYGSWNGEISFYEPMISLAMIASLRGAEATSQCYPIRQPPAWRWSGHYPTVYCVGYRANRGEFTVSLEGFVARQGSR